MPSPWRIEYEPRAQRQLKKLDRTAAGRIVRDLQEDLDRVGDPRAFGEAMVGNWTGFWRYRVGDFIAPSPASKISASPSSSSKSPTAAKSIADARLGWNPIH